MAGEIQLNSVTLATESGGVASIDSSVDIKGPLNASGSAPIYACRAWVNFNGTGTVAIRASGNVTSVTDNGTGDYTINFTTAMPDANYSVVGAVNQNQTTALADFSLQGTQSTTSVEVASHVTNTYTRTDSEIVCVSIFR